MLTLRRNGLWLLVVSLVLFCTSDKAAHAADAAADARAEFDQVYAQFKGILQKATDIQDRYPAASPTDRPKLAEQFNELVRQGELLRPKLKQLAEKAYVANPKDKELGEMLFAILSGAMATDSYEEALPLAKLLIDHDYPEPKLDYYAGASAFDICDFDAADKYLRLAQTAGTLDEPGKQLVDLTPAERIKWEREQKLRAAEAKADNLPRVELTIGDASDHEKGKVVVELFENEAPNTVANFVSLVEQHKYDGLLFHRVLSGFMAQGGDPKGDGTGGPDYHIKDECNLPDHRDHFRGSLSMAHSSEPNSNGSQFFICYRPTDHLDGLHTVFGRVLEGMDVVDHLQRGETEPGKPPAFRPDKILKAKVLRKREHAYEPQKLP